MKAPSEDRGVAGNDSARLLTRPANGRVAVGFASGRFCVIQLKTDRVVAEVQAASLNSSRASLLVAELTSEKLITYGYQPRVSRPFRPIPDPKAPATLPEAGGELRVWDARTGKKLSDVNVGGATAAALSSDGERFVLGSDKLRLLTQTGRLLWTNGERVRRIVFAGAERLLATDGERLFSLSLADGTQKALFESYWGASSDHPYSDIVVTPDGRHAISTFSDGRLVLWDVGARHELKRASEERVSLEPSAISTDGLLLVSRSAALLGIRQLELLDAPNGPIECIALSADARRALACHERWRPKEFERWRSAVFELWDSERHELRRWPRDTGAEAMLSDDGKHVLVRKSGGNEVRSWSSGQLLSSNAHYMWTAAAISPDGGRAATLDWSRTTSYWRITLRDALAGKIIWQNAEERAGKRVLRFDRDGRRLVVQDADRKLVFLNTSDGSAARRLGPVEPARWVLLGHGRALIASEDRNVLTAYDLETGARSWSSIEKHWRLAVVLSGDGRSFFSLDDKSVRLRSLATGRDWASASISSQARMNRDSLAASSDGTTLVVGTERGVLLRFRLRIEQALRGGSKDSKIRARTDEAGSRFRRMTKARRNERCRSVQTALRRRVCGSKPILLGSGTATRLRLASRSTWSYPRYPASSKPAEMRARDTTQAAHDHQVRLYRSMKDERRAELALEMSHDARRVAAEGIRQRHPNYSELEVRHALVALLYGREAAAKLWPAAAVPAP